MGLSEQEFKLNLQGVDALIMGSVAELGRDEPGGSWLVGKQRTQRARARVVLRMVDPKTGAVFYSQEGSGDATLSSTSTLGSVDIWLSEVEFQQPFGEWHESSGAYG